MYPLNVSTLATITRGVYTHLYMNSILDVLGHILLDVKLEIFHQRRIRIISKHDLVQN